MSVDKNHSEQFEKYLKGKMSPEEAHAFERDVLNDPFAQEALEGFEAADAGAFDDVAKLKTRISSTKSNSFSWMRIAAAVALLIVGSYSIFYFTNEIEGDQLALEEEPLEKSLQSSPSPDTVSTPTLLGESSDQQEDESKTDSEEKFYAARDKSEAEETLSTEDMASGETDDQDAFLAENQETEEVTADLELETEAFEDNLQGRKASVQVAQVEEPTPEISVDTTLLEEVVVSAQPLVAKKESLGNAERTISDEEIATKSVRPSGASLRSTGNTSLVSGTVTDDTGEPLPGVNVFIKGTTSGVTTDDDGRYVLSDVENETLIFAFVGFESQEIEVGDRADIDVMLAGDELELQEVVVAGYDEDLQEDGPSYAPARPDIGNRAFRQYIEENLVYPEAAKANNIEGLVVLELTIDDNGQVSNVDIKKSLGYGCDQEAMRLINEGPRWIAAAKDGIAVEDKLRIRVRFKLDR